MLKAIKEQTWDSNPGPLFQIQGSLYYTTLYPPPALSRQDMSRPNIRTSCHFSVSENCGWLHSALSKPLSSPLLFPETFNLKMKEASPSIPQWKGGEKMVFCSFLRFTDNSGDTAQPRISAAIVLCMFYSFTYTSICPG